LPAIAIVVAVALLTTLSIWLVVQLSVHQSTTNF
jgi:hypothetical protein